MTGLLRIGEVIDKYRIEALIGQGGMAAVYRARHITLDSLHAVKILFITAPSVRQRLLREGRVQANLRHPNIVAVTDVLEVMGSPALVMEYIDGPALDQWLLEQEPTLEEAMFLFRGVLRGIMAAHERGVVHRDLKPANVMLSSSNEGVVPKVTDFGLVKSLGDQKGKTQTGMAMGTPEYMAPEQIRDASDVDQRVDMFALGCILYELVCHRRAFAGPDNVSVFNAIVSGTYPPPRKFVEDLPSNVHEAIRATLEPDREKRLSSCVELFDLLFEEQTVGRLGALRTSMAPIQISGTMPEVPASTVQRTPEQAPEPEPPPKAETPPPSEQVTRPPHSDPPVRPATDPDLGLSPPPSTPMRLVVPVAVTLIGGVIVGALLFGGGGSGGEPKGTTQGTEADLGTALTPEPRVTVEAPQPEPDAGTAEDGGSNGEGSATEDGGSAEGEGTDGGAAEGTPQAIAGSGDDDVAVAPKPEPAPKPAASPKPAPVVPAPAPAAGPAGANVQISGDARQVWLEADGKRLAAGEGIPPGTYRILADFGGPEPAPAGSITLREGQTVKLGCTSFLFQCRPL